MLKRIKKNRLLNHQRRNIHNSIRDLQNKPTEKLKYLYFRRSILVPLITSLVAACIFWLVFDYIPNQNRYNKIRPKITHGMHDISKDLFSVFNVVMSKDLSHSNRFYGLEIFSGKLNKEDFEIGLQNKCMNNTARRDSISRKYLIPIGEFIFNHFNNISIKIDELFKFSEFMSADEIILFERIKKTLFIYDIASFQKPVTGLNPSLSYLSANLFDLYTLYKTVLPIIYEEDFNYIPINIYQDIIFPLTVVDYHLYITKDYNKCIKSIKKLEEIYPNSSHYSEIICEYLLGEKDKGFNLFVTYLNKSKIPLISQSGIIKMTSPYDDRIIKFIKENYSSSEVEKLIHTIEKEKADKIAFTENNKFLKNYFSSLN